MADVARLAGVSPVTVSRVFNRHPSVRSTTRARVLDAAQTLSYRPNFAARALASGRSGVIGVLAMETTLFGPASHLYTIERAARAAGYFVSIVSIDSPNSSAISDAVEHLALQRVEGVVAVAPLTGSTEATPSFPADLRVVLIEGGEGAGRSVVSIDQVGGAAAVTEHLLSEGAPTVWHIAGPDNWLEARQRITGWRRALEGAGVDVPEPLAGDWTPASGYELGQRLAERASVRAVFVANDQMALGVLRALHERGLRVPDDVLVAGFDDTPESAYYTPPLTTVRQDFVASGKRSIEVLLDEIEGRRTEPTLVLVPAKLVIRQSSVGQRRPHVASHGER
jgi:DNA-binding LacI/PurR family transcriptional regulator